MRWLRYKAPSHALLAPQIMLGGAGQAAATVEGGLNAAADFCHHMSELCYDGADRIGELRDELQAEYEILKKRIEYENGHLDEHMSSRDAIDLIKQLEFQKHKLMGIVVQKDVELAELRGQVPTEATQEALKHALEFDKAHREPDPVVVDEDQKPPSGNDAPPEQSSEERAAAIEAMEDSEKIRTGATSVKIRSTGPVAPPVTEAKQVVQY